MIASVIKHACVASALAVPDPRWRFSAYHRTGRLAMRRRDIAVRSVAMACVLSLGMSACVFNPYIKTPLPDRVTCQSNQALPQSQDSDKGTADKDGVAYAACAREAMEKKARSYALMNNAGAAFLLNLAGLASYRAFRGGNEANVAALVTGGAALYGTQQYLYRKPREAIYFVGSATIGCALGITRRRMLVRQDELQKNLEALVATVAQGSTLNASLDTVRRFEAHSPNTQCPATVLQKWNEASASVTGASGSASITAIKNRQLLAQQRIWRLGDMYRNANGDLITVTDAVVASVNHQLTQEQPDPAQIALSITSLKLATLQGAAPRPAPSPESVSPAQTLLGERSLGGRSTLFESRCNVTPADIDAFAAAVRTFVNDRDTADAAMTGFEQRLADIETAAQGSVEGIRKDCPIGPPPAIVPFALKPLQEGTQIVTQDGTLVIPFEGGTPPYKIIPSAAEKADTLVGTPAESPAGDRRFEVKAALDAKTGVYSMIANDAGGSVKVIQVEIKAKPKGG